MRIAITENAATILDALHAGCRASYYSNGDGGEPEFRVKPTHIVPRRAKAKGNRQDETGPWKDVVYPLFYKAPYQAFYEYDEDKMRRVDTWQGGDEPTSFAISDALILVRGGLMEMSNFGVEITAAGRAIAQARIGDGVLVVDQADLEIKPIRVEPNANFKIGMPVGFNVNQPVAGDPYLRLSTQELSIHFTVRSDDHHVTAGFDRPVARTIASMLNDAGKWATPTETTFDRVTVILRSSGEVSLHFGDDGARATVLMTKQQAKVVRTYLLELAKGAESPMNQVVRSVQLEIRDIVMPEAIEAMPDPGELSELSDEWKMV